jgi:hypothetical protein
MGQKPMPDPGCNRLTPDTAAYTRALARKGQLVSQISGTVCAKNGL